MSLKPGDRITYRLMPEIHRYNAAVISVDDRDLALRIEADSAAAIARGRYLLISEPDTDVDHYGEITSWDGRTLGLHRMWTGKRGYFRVDDVFPVVWRKVDKNDLRRESKVFSGYGVEIDELDVADESINPRLWKMLTDINAKLSAILDRLSLESEGLSSAESIPVNISASGIRFTTTRKVEVGDVLELKMLLPVYPPVGVLANGTVMRVTELENGSFGTSLHFVDLADEARDLIIQYALKRQRELMRRQREREGSSS
jgi:hypothetical protein